VQVLQSTLRVVVEEQETVVAAEPQLLLWKFR
jgi:hypothetical protein